MDQSHHVFFDVGLVARLQDVDALDYELLPPLHPALQVEALRQLEVDVDEHFAGLAHDERVPARGRDAPEAL